MFAAQTPLAEVLAVVAEEAIAVLADSGAGSPNHLLTDEANRTVGPDPQSASINEACERNLVHLPPVKSKYQGAVMDDPAAADIDTVVGETKTRCNEVRAQRGFFPFGELPIVPPKYTAKATSVLRDSTLILPCVRLRMGTTKTEKLLREL
jgi:hypothetical protein